MATTSREIIGREDELAQLERLLADQAPSSAALLLHGEAGIGKSTVWLAGVELAASRGMRVLSCRPAEAESLLPYAALGDLLEPVLDEVLPLLPEPAGESLGGVLGLPKRGGETDRLAVSRAWLATLRLLAESRVLVLAVDDVQWLDAASADVLRFAARRVGALPIRLLIARRDEPGSIDPLELRTALPPERLETMHVGPLPVDALDDLVRARLVLQLPRPKLVRLHELSSGNPFYALEIAAAAQRRGAAGDGSELTLPGSLAGVVTDRLRLLPADGADAVVLTAACPQPTELLIGRALGATGGMAAAIAQGILRIDGTRLRFTHPLLASAAYEGTAPWERRDAHRRLAAVIADPEERAHQLGLSADEPDAEIAALLEQAAEAAAARGAIERAAGLSERAAELTPGHLTDDAARRGIRAAALHESAGDIGRTRELLEDLVTTLDPGPLRSEAQLRLLTSRFGTGALAESEQQLERLLEKLDLQPSLQSEAHASIAATLLAALRLQDALRHFRRAAELAEEADERRTLALALGDAAFVECMLTCAVPPSAERAVALWPRGRAPLGYNPRVGHGVMLTWLDVHDAARDVLLEEAKALPGEGAESERATITLHLTELELRAGNWASAGEYARQTHRLARQAMHEQATSASLYAVGLVDAHFGKVASARIAASSGLAQAEELGDRWFWVQHRAVLGFLELSLGNPAAAHDWLGPAAELLVRMDVGELSIFPILQNEIEALVALGRLDEAEAAIGYVEEKGRAAQRAWHEAIAARGRALVAAERGDLVAAREAIERALSAHERLPQPFELGRTLLVRGMIERRARHHGSARDALVRALEAFDALGAPLWSEKAAMELARVPGRRRDDSPALTETERRVAELVAQGLSNKQVAAALFVTVRTVEAALTRIYRKLGVRSRTELAARLQ